MIATDSQHLQRSTRRFAVRASIATWIRQRSWSHLTVGLIIGSCVVLAWAISTGLWTLGVSWMWLRYPIALGGGYATFVFLLGIQVKRYAQRLALEVGQLQRESALQQTRPHEDDQLDLGKLLDVISDVAEENARQVSDPRLLPVWATVGLAVTLVAILLYYVWAAPLLLGEVLTEGGLAPWIYRPISRGPFSNWRQVALELTGPAAIIMALSILGIGIAMSLFAPQATHIGEVWDQVLEFREMNIQRRG